MLIDDNMKTLLPLLTIFISGIFGLITVVVIWKLSFKREKNNLKQDFAIQDYKKTELFFVELLASLTKTIRYTEGNSDYSLLQEELSIITAKTCLLADNAINDKLSAVSLIMFEWSSEYRQGLPSRVGDTTFAIASTLDSIHKENAAKIYVLLLKEMSEMIELMKQQLSDLKQQMRNN